MVTPIRNKAMEVVFWHDRCAAMGHPHTDQDQRDYITRRWGDLDVEIREAIHAEALSIRAHS